MNRENILRVANAIETGELVKRGIGFNMAAWIDPARGYRPDMTGHDCKTVACIGGTAKLVLNPDDDNEDDGEKAVVRAFGISDGEATDLFYAAGSEKPLDEITPSHAVAVLRHLAETGEVDWSVPDPASPDQPENNNG